MSSAKKQKVVIETLQNCLKQPNLGNKMLVIGVSKLNLEVNSAKKIPVKYKVTLRDKE